MPEMRPSKPFRWRVDCSYFLWNEIVPSGHALQAHLGGGGPITYLLYRGGHREEGQSQHDLFVRMLHATSFAASAVLIVSS